MKILVAACDNSHAKELFAQFKALDDRASVTFVGPGENLLDAVRHAAPDVVIVDMARPDRDGLDSVRALNAQTMLPVLMFIDEDDPQFMEEAIDAGVCSYHAGGVALPAIKPILRAAMAVFQRMQGLQTRLAEAEDHAETRNTIDAAKRLLMAQDKMTEPMAHRYLQRRAMAQQKKLKDAALGLLSERAVRGDTRSE
ncbi:MAG: ANTAR domain-containing protein [Rhodospirillales bacterium]|nr:ANTAR domain-containing protein [Rhodospirillales bacterium]MDE2318691.1 ANTAR domain-containing protein [Rhodospirillales bacterium]